MSEAGGQKNKESLSGRAEKVKIAYTLIGKGKGGRRKRTLSEVLYIISDKEVYFVLLPRAKNDQQDSTDDE